MPQIDTKLISELRKQSGAGISDCKKALEESDGDIEKAKQYLREKGLAGAAKRGDREASQGAVATAIAHGAGAIVELRSETDFVAKSPQFVSMVEDLARLAAAEGESALASKNAVIDDLKISLKENISLGRVVRYEAGGDILDSYLHVQSGHGVNAVLVQLAGGSQELAHDIAVHIAFARPRWLTKDDVPADVVAAERETLEKISRNEGKPEASIPKIVEGRIQGFFKEVCLLEQPFAKDEKKTISQMLGGAKVVRFSQIEVGA